MPLHLIKLCVGCDTVDDLLAWRAQSAIVGEPWLMRTRQTPRRAEELIDGGSLYRVYRGQILSRQRILGVRTVERDRTPHCEVTLADEVIRTVPMPRRAFQGWRYLDPKDAPRDLKASDKAKLPDSLRAELTELGLL